MQDEVYKVNMQCQPILKPFNRQIMIEDLFMATNNRIGYWYQLILASFKYIGNGLVEKIIPIWSYTQVDNLFYLLHTEQI